ncbi:uncharacterized protein P7C73_g3257, partial [Tremellales sp. Uapishka_1]
MAFPPEQQSILTRPSASNVSRVHNITSPLAQLGLSSGIHSYNNVASSSTFKAPPPALDFNLFRSNSLYSIESTTSLDTFSQDGYGHDEDDDDVNGGESPSTPKASRTQYFNPTSPSLPPVQSTPTRSFQVTSRGPPVIESTSTSRGATVSDLNPIVSHREFNLKPIPSIKIRGKIAPIPRAAPVSLQPETSRLDADLESIYGEQGSEWGEDEGTFEWLDNHAVPEAVNGNGAGLVSPSKRFSKLKAAVTSGGQGGEGGVKRLRKQLVFPRRAPPPPPPPPADGVHNVPISPPARMARLPKSSKEESVLRVHNSQPQVGEVYRPRYAEPTSPLKASFQQPVAQTYLLAPTMVPMKGADADTAPRTAKELAHQSVAYSFYDLDGSEASPSTPKGELLFPNGKYTKVSASSLDSRSEDGRDRERSISEPTSARKVKPQTAEDFLRLGIEARGRNDLAKSAWYFLKAAECGSPTGRMYRGGWTSRIPSSGLDADKGTGLSLRHGWGVAKDEKRAFMELRQACDENFSKGGMDFHNQSPATIKLTSQQQKSTTRDLSMGLFEIANCFLDGVGVKKAPDIALNYLRFAANMGDLASQERGWSLTMLRGPMKAHDVSELGYLLSKGHNGIKKDMKEAAKWYRTAIGQGSSNTFGLAWVWKDKYMN